MPLNDLFACPQCCCDLQLFTKKWVCPNCKKEWIVDNDGVVHFLADPYFFGADKKKFSELLNEIRKMTYDQFNLSIKRLEEKYRDFSYSYCLDVTRADWTVLGDFYEKTIVDLGCGFGSISLPLARKAKRVISLDATSERLSFLSLLAQLEGIKNIIPIHSDAFNLPLKHGSIDAFVVIGLLEWIGCSKKDVSPEELQKRFLKNLCNLLSNKGEIWIGIENRLNPYYFTGGTSHGDLPFTPLMPRFIADSIYRIVKGDLYRTRTYTKSEYQELLRSVGLREIEFFHTFPHYQRPNFISSHSEKKIISKYLKKANYTGRKLKILTLLDRFHLSEVFAPAFLIRAKKGN